MRTTDRRSSRAAVHLDVWIRSTPSNGAAVPYAAGIALVTDDVPAAHEYAIVARAREVKGPSVKPWGQIVSYVRDLNGVLVELATPVGG